MPVDVSSYFRCQDLIHRFWSALDNRRLDEIMLYLSPDARWQRERWYEGVSAIRGALEARPTDLTIRHIVTNLIVDRDGANFIARMFMVPQLAKAEEGAFPPFKAAALSTLGELTVKIAQTGQDLTISEIGFEIVFHADLA